MTIHYTLTGAGDTLMVYASGFDESLTEVQDWADETRPCLGYFCPCR